MAIEDFRAEMVFAGGEEGLEVLSQLNPESCELVKSKIANGSELQPTEDAELAMENMDWERCLMVAMGQKVRTKIIEFHSESSLKRYEYISKTIGETLKDFEVGILFVREWHRTQFPQNMEVFNVYPPAFDELNRWLRDYSQRIGTEAKES